MKEVQFLVEMGLKYKALKDHYEKARVEVRAEEPYPRAIDAEKASLEVQEQIVLAACRVLPATSASDGGREMVRELVEAIEPFVRIGQLMAVASKPPYKIKYRPGPKAHYAKIVAIHAKAKEWLEGRGNE